MTPYRDEPLAVLERCHASVRAQGPGVVHVLVADGSPNPVLDTWDAQHLVLAGPHGDGGNTPRAIGAISAFNQGFDGVAMLDADNWYAPDHLAHVLQAAADQSAAVVFSDRLLVLETGEVCPFDDVDVVLGEHVDTSCFYIDRRAAFLAAMWGMMDPGVWPACDRVMLSFVRALEIPHAWTRARTVCYETHWKTHYIAMGRTPPDHPHWIDWAKVEQAYSFEEMSRRYGKPIAERPETFCAPPWPSLVGRKGPVAPYEAD